MTDSTHDRDLVQLPRTAVAALLRRLASGRSAAEAAASLREVGVDAAGPLYDALRGRIGSDDPAQVSEDAFWSALAALLRELGWGTLVQDRPHPGVIALTGRDWFEAEGGAGAHPGCHFTTGVLAELFRNVAGSDLAALEVECRSTGGESCRFLIGSPAALEGIFEEMERGNSYQGAISALA